LADTETKDSDALSLSPEDVERVSAALRERVETLRCPMCTREQMVMAPWFFKHQVALHLEKAVVGGPTVPVAPLVCTHCGFMSQHSLGILGLLPWRSVATAEVQQP
jgi:predicted Zn-ribbon and HTH transcriptional regulator